ncbi:hypothetical protein JOF43_000321 [Brachybacterium sacelli]|uniref:Alpha-L-arabinofuranosidase 1 catalytic domain-containing protein n=1 Tax=Brachybacterium sacelli TaxID=173364 RepID=A0ABS4WXX1_9MICO|nr:hypothetical protein [Brachybacterium sacelli]
MTSSSLTRSLVTSLATASTGSTRRTAGGPASVVVDLDLPGPTISRHLYGHFAEHLGRCIYGGFFVGEDSEIPNTRGIRHDVVEALRALRIPNLRWPGGCFADEYHWKDGIGPREDRPRMVNSHWGDVVEDNSFGTHEFMDLVELLGTDAYVNGNVGSGTVAEMSEWIEYLTRADDSPMASLRRGNGRDEPWKVPFFGIGNESWGCGGNMRAEDYAALARQPVLHLRARPGRRPGEHRHPHRRRRQRRRLRLDRVAHARRHPSRCARGEARPLPGDLPAQLHDDRPLGEQGQRHRVLRRGVVPDPRPRRPHRGAGGSALHGHGPLRPVQEGRPGAG